MVRIEFLRSGVSNAPGDILGLISETYAGSCLAAE